MNPPILNQRQNYIIIYMWEHSSLNWSLYLRRSPYATCDSVRAPLIVNQESGWDILNSVEYGTRSSNWPNDKAGHNLIIHDDDLHFTTTQIKSTVHLVYISLTGVVYDGNQKQLAKVKNQLRPLIASQNASDRCTVYTNYNTYLLDLLDIVK